MKRRDPDWYVTLKPTWGEILAIGFVLLLFAGIYIHVRSFKDPPCNRERAARGDIQTLSNAVEQFALANLYSPPNLEVLASGSKKYVRALVDDPWGNPYTYKIIGPAGEFLVTSVGPDDVPGTTDDVTSRSSRRAPQFWQDSKQPHRENSIKTISFFWNIVVDFQHVQSGETVMQGVAEYEKRNPM